jgi:excisionase family DNA binding protein
MPRSSDVTKLEPLLLTAKDAMTLLRVGRTKFYQLVSERLVRGVMVGRRKMYRRADLVRYVERLQTAAG